MCIGVYRCVLVFMGVCIGVYRCAYRCVEVCIGVCMGVCIGVYRCVYRCGWDRECIRTGTSGMIILDLMCHYKGRPGTATHAGPG